MQNQNSLIELPPDLPDFPTALVNLGRVPLVLYQALEDAAEKTSEFRDRECPGERLDEGLAATLLRFHAKRFLKLEGIDAQDEELTLDWLPFLGISFHYTGYHVRILKGADGCLPGCGNSEKKIRFYGQIATMYLVGNQAQQTSANLLVLWDFNAVYGLKGLWLALPAIGGSRPEDVSAFWRELLPHPAEGLSGVEPPPTPPDDDLDELIVPLEQQPGRERGK